jgi:uncharacterized protein (TIGR03435 family)
MSQALFVRWLLPERLVLRNLLFIALAPGLAFAQPGGRLQEFEVVSIKPSAGFTPADLASGRIHLGMRISPGRVEIGFTPLKSLIALAFRVEPEQVSGPDWMATSQPFDIVAKMPEGASREQVPEMLRALLVERFKLSAHAGTKDQPVYALVAGRNGPRMKESAPDKHPTVPNPKTPITADYESGDSHVMATGKGNSGIAFISGGAGGEMKVSMANGLAHLEVSDMTIDGLAKILMPQFDRPVVNMTGLKGRYEFMIDVPANSYATRSRAVVSPRGDSLSAPLQEDLSNSSIRASLAKLGLELDKRTAPVSVVVVDHVEKMPTDN